MRQDRKALAAIALALLLATAGCASVVSGTDSRPSADRPGAEPAGSTPVGSSPAGPRDRAVASHRSDVTDRRIAVDASARVQASPDRAVVRVGVRASARDAATARRRLAKNVTRMRKALAAAGVGGDQITTVDFDVDRDYRRSRREGDRPTVRYEARHAFLITLRDLNRTGRVIVTAVENGATRVDDVRFVLSERTREELHDRALAAAVRDARRQADVIAHEEGLRVTGVRSVRTGGGGFSSHVERHVTAAATPAPGGAPTSIDTGTVTVSVRVTVVYDAESAG